MAKRIKKLTNSSDETDISKLLSSDSIFSIPYFQRPYTWKKERLRQIEKDILSVVDESTDTHFLGAIIIHGRRSNPSEPTLYEVIDGQQRITTLFLYILAIIRVLAKRNYHDQAIALFQKYIAIGRNISFPSNIKLHPCKEDRAQLNAVLKEIISDITFKQKNLDHICHACFRRQAAKRVSFEQILRQRLDLLKSNLSRETPFWWVRFTKRYWTT